MTKKSNKSCKRIVKSADSGSSTDQSDQNACGQEIDNLVVPEGQGNDANAQDGMDADIDATRACGPEAIVVGEMEEMRIDDDDEMALDRPISPPEVADPTDPLGLAALQPLGSDEQREPEKVPEDGEIEEMEGDESRHSHLQDKINRQKVQWPSDNKPLYMTEEEGMVVDKLQVVSLRAQDKLMSVDGQRPRDEELNDEKVPQWYLVSQVTSKGAVASRIKVAEQWPDLLWVDNATLPQTTRPLEVGDSLKVNSVTWAQTETGWAGAGEWLIPSNKRLNHQAVANEVSECSQSNFSTALGLVLNVDRDRRRDGDRHVKSATIAAPELPTIMRIQRRHMAPGMEQFLDQHSLVQMKLISINRPPAVFVSQHYVLPVGFPYKNGDETLAQNAKIIASVEPEVRRFEYPFDKSLSWASLELGEKVMACAISAQKATIVQDQQRFTLVVQIARVDEIEETKINLAFRHQLQTMSQMMDMLEVWEEDTAVSCRVDQSDLTRPCASGYVRQIQKRETGNGFEVRIEVFLAFQEAKGQNAMKQFEFLRDGALETVELKPMISTRALRDRADIFKASACSAAANTNSNPVSKILSILLGREIPPGSSVSKPDENVMQKGALGLLKAGQRETAELMMDEVPRVLFQQAGPGTGKTFSAAAIMSAVLKEDKKARVLALAPPNIAVVKLVMEMQDAMAMDEQASPMLALFSGTGKLHYAEEVRRISPHLLAAAVDSEEFQHVLEQTDLRKVRNYMRDCVRNPRLANEATVAAILKEHAERKVCFATLAFAEQTASLFGETTHLLLDEAGQAPFSQVLSLVCQLPRLKKLLITGDRRQLSVHLLSLPFAIRENLGLDTIIQNLDMAVSVNVTTLNVSYRSHPSIVRCVEAAFYKPHGEALTPGRSPDERALLTGQTHIKLPVKDCPIILIHQEDEAAPDNLSRSTSNTAQTNTAMLMLWRLCQAVPADTVIRCICLYTAQMIELSRIVREEGLSNVLVTTADATQGHESSLAVVVTTVSRNSLDSAVEMPFWAMPNRVNVALSRASHGLVVIGNLLVLGQKPAWNQFITEALKETTVVPSDYVFISRDSTSKHDSRGRLVMEGGGVVRSDQFYEKWGRNGCEGSRAGGPNSVNRRDDSRYRPYNFQERGRGQGWPRR